MRSALTRTEGAVLSHVFAVQRPRTRAETICQCAASRPAMYRAIFYYQIRYFNEVENASTNWTCEWKRGNISQTQRAGVRINRHRLGVETEIDRHDMWTHIKDRYIDIMVFWLQPLEWCFLKKTLVNKSYDLLVERFLVFSLIFLDHFGSPLLFRIKFCSGFASRPGPAAIRVGAQNTHSLAEERARFLERRPNEKPRICIPPWACSIPPQLMVRLQNCGSEKWERAFKFLKCATFLQNLAHDDNTGLVLRTASLIALEVARFFAVSSWSAPHTVCTILRGHSI